MLTIGTVQFSPVRRDPGANLRAVTQLLEGIRADVLVLPELANSGYLYGSPAELAPFAEPGDGSGPFLGGLIALAAQTGGVIAAGFAERAGSGLYNSAAAVCPDGVLQVYRKTHLFAGEKDLFQPGDSGFQVFDHAGAGLGLMICFDWVFPEAARSLALLGADIILHPSNLVLPYCQQAMLTRSLENCVFSITANRCGTETLAEQSLTFTGASQVVDPKGVRLAQAPLDAAQVDIVAIEPARARNKWMTGRNHLFDDRRPDMYSL